jgi:hypothetical protein
VVFATPNLRIFAVPHPRPLVSAPARVLAVGYSTIRLAVPRAGTYRLGVTYTPYWKSRAACLERSPDGMTRLVARRPAVVRLRFAVTPVRALETIAGDTTERCG